MSEALVVTGVTKRFGGLTAIDNVDLRVAGHSIASLIGPNGAGKTTLFNCVSGFYPPDEGDITVAGGHSLVGRTPDQIARLGVSRTFQNIRLFRQMTALENILVGHHNHLTARWYEALVATSRMRREESEALALAHGWLRFVGLAGLGDQPACNLPYGAERRLEVARALANRPSLLMLDEPTAGMNPHETADMMRLITRLRDDLGIAVLLIEHDMRVVMGVSDQVTVLDYGRKIAEGTPAEVQADAKVIEAYLGRGAANARALAQGRGGPPVGDASRGADADRAVDRP